MKFKLDLKSQLGRMKTLKAEDWILITAMIAIIGYFAYITPLAFENYMPYCRGLFHGILFGAAIDATIIAVHRMKGRFIKFGKR